MEKRLNFTDRYLSLWIFLAMAIGVALGRLYPQVSDFIGSLSQGSVSIPIALGLILMMYPPLAKVDFTKLSEIFSNYKIILLSLGITWIVAPILMFGISILTLSDMPSYMSGVILIGIAPCIAMVIVWNDLAGGSRELIAVLVAINSVLQILFFSVFTYFYMVYLPSLFGIQGYSINITIYEIAKTVLIYLGIPFFAAVILRSIFIKVKGIEWYNRKYIPRISPFTLYALLFTILVMFALKGNIILELPIVVFRVAIPLVLYFAIMFFMTFYITMKSGANYSQTVSLAFTASGNNFELAIAVAISVFGINSEQAFAGVVGPLVEVPVLLLLVNVAVYFKNKFFKI